MKPPAPVRRKKPDPIGPDLVLLWFRTCWPKAKRYPGTGACWHVVYVLRSVLQVHKGLLVAADGWEEVRGDRRKTPQPSPDTLVALKHARLFVRHAPCLVRYLGGRAESQRLGWEADADGRHARIVVDTDAHADALTVFAQLNQAVRATTKALDAIEASGLLAPWPTREPERSICQAAQVAWGTVLDAKVPRGVGAGLPARNRPKPPDPLCLFVQKAMEAIGKRETISTISAVLKGKRRPVRTRRRPNKGTSRVPESVTS